MLQLWQLPQLLSAADHRPKQQLLLQNTPMCAMLIQMCWCFVVCACAGVGNVRDEHRWGPHDQCDMNKPHDWLKRSRSNCYSCMTGANVCTDPPTMLYHQYLEYLHPERWEGNMLSVKVFLMTQVC
jgi:hypothetical protein